MAMPSRKRVGFQWPSSKPARHVVNWRARITKSQQKALTKEEPVKRTNASTGFENGRYTANNKVGGGEAQPAKRCPSNECQGLPGRDFDSVGNLTENAFNSKLPVCWRLRFYEAGTWPTRAGHAPGGATQSRRSQPARWQCSVTGKGGVKNKSGMSFSA
jgi:hypothetical protein